MERNELTWKLGVVLSLAEEFLNHWQERNAEEDDREEEQRRKEAEEDFLAAKPLIEMIPGFFPIIIGTLDTIIWMAEQELESIIEGHKTGFYDDEVLESARKQIAMAEAVRYFSKRMADVPFWISNIKKYTSVEVRPVRFEDKKNPKECHVCEPEQADFWSVYGRDQEGFADCFEDFKTEDEAKAFAEVLALIFPLMEYRPEICD